MSGSTARATQSRPPRGSHAIACVWFWAWAIPGALGTLGLVSFALGPIALGAALIAGAALATRQAARGSGFGLLAGAGLVFLFIAYVQREGPGTTCWHTATASGCDGHLNPIPWLVIGLLLLLAGILLHQHHGD